MKAPPCRPILWVLILAASATVTSAGPVDSAAWEAVDEVLGRPGKVFPGDIHKYGWPRSDLQVTVGGVKVEHSIQVVDKRVATTGDFAHRPALPHASGDAAPLLHALLGA